jgi:O-antigen/teichoic acid export membrane protein
VSKPDGNGRGHRDLARLSSGVLLANAVAAIAIAGTAVLTARLLGPSGRGQFSLATLLATLALTLGTSGLGAALTYQTARGERPKQMALGAALILGLALGGTITVVGYCVVGLGGLTLKGVAETDILISLLILPGAFVLTNVQSVYLGLQRFRAFNAITIAQAVLPLALIGIVLGLGGGVRSAIAAMVGATTALGACAAVLAVRSMRLSSRLDRPYVRSLFAYAWRVLPANVLGFLGYRLDVFILDGYRGTAAVGLYSAGVVIAEGLWMPSQAVSVALFPRIAAETDDAVRRALTPRVARNTFWLTALLGLVLYLLSRPVVTLLYSSAFAASAGALKALLPGIVAVSAARVLGNDIAARGRPLTMSVLAAISVAANIVLNLVLIPRYGIDGAAWASTASYSILFAATVAVYRQVAGVPLRTILLPSREDGAAYLRLARRTLPSRGRRMAGVDTFEQR